MSTLQGLDDAAINKIVDAVIGKIGASIGNTPAPVAPTVATNEGQYGIFNCAAAAAKAAQSGYEQLCEKGVDARKKVIDIVKTMCVDRAEEWGAFEFNETKIGRPEHKPEKLKLVPLVPGVEWLAPRGMSGDNGITLEEFTPFGVIGSILPMTHSIPTLAGNVINMVAAGNSIVFNPHPGGAKSAVLATQEFNKAIERETGITNLICTIAKPTLESFDAICKAPEVALLCITGGPAVVNAALKSGKRAICAGPGNPPVLVDETADLVKAAQSIVSGGAFDNNLLCIAEKAVFVVESVFQPFMRAMQAAGCIEVSGTKLQQLTDAAFDFKTGEGGCSHPVLKRDMVGKGAEYLASKIGISVPKGTELLIAETDADHAFVVEEQMMSVMPIVKVKDVAEGIEMAKRAEHGYKHSAMIHSKNVENMTAMARALDTTIFVKNGACTAGLGLGGEGYISYSIATTTGEGITNPQTFTRTRRCVMVENLKIY